MKNKTKIAAVVAVLVAPFVAKFEGLSHDLRDYWDSHGRVATACYGHTETAVVGKKRTQAECTAMLLKDLESYAREVDNLIIVDVHPSTLAAATSLSYNIGVGAFSRSTALKRFNRGDIAGGCNAFLLWNKAGGRVLNGLTKRRAAERKLCLKGVYAS